MLWLDLDELDAIEARLWLLSIDRPNLLSFRQSDHGAGGSAPLREWVDDKLDHAGIVCGGPVRLLSIPRILGYAFNPLSVFFCFDRVARLKAIIYEVNNIVGERHCYVVPITDPADRSHRHLAAKSFDVSPFLPIAGHYRFRLTIPDDYLRLSIQLVTEEGVLLTARQIGSRRDLTDLNLLRGWLRDPLTTFKVVASIYVQALRLLSKGARFRRRSQRAQLHRVAAPIDELDVRDH